MKEKVFIAVLSIATVVSGALLAFAETCLLVNHGATPEEALIESLYSGFLGWIILAASLTTTDRFWSWANRIIKK